VDVNYLLKPDRRKEPFRPTEVLPFGELRTDHVFVREYRDGAWQKGVIKPYDSNPQIMWGAKGLSYSMGCFEGSGARRLPDGKIYTFRFAESAKRMNKSATRLVLPHIPEEEQMEAVHHLIDVERLWYPEQEGAYFYVRPVLVATQDCAKVGKSKEFKYYVFVSPSSAYFPQGFQAASYLITDRFHRAAPGGTGNTKASANYAGTILPKELAGRLGALEVLYLDVTNTWIEEYGAMNFFHVTRDGIIHIPSFSDTILESITARSFLELPERMKRELGHEIIQEPVRLNRLMEGLRNGDITEAGGLGTAAGVSPVGKYFVDFGRKNKLEDLSTESIGEQMVGDSNAGRVSTRMFNLLTDIRTGRREAPKGWLEEVARLDI